MGFFYAAENFGNVHSNSALPQIACFHNLIRFSDFWISPINGTYCNFILKVETRKRDFFIILFYSSKKIINDVM